MLKATHKEYEQLVGLQKVILQPGQFVYGRLKASEQLKIKPSTLNDLVTWLKNEQIIDIKTNNKYSVITIVNWDLYQIEEVEANIKTDSKPTANQQQTDTNKNVKNDKNKKNIKDIVDKPHLLKFIPPILDEVKAYCTERNNKVDPERFIDYYIANGWVQGKGKPIKDWKATVRTWERNDNAKPFTQKPGPPNKANFTQRQYSDADIERMYKE